MNRTNAELSRELDRTIAELRRLQARVPLKSAGAAYLGPIYARCGSLNAFPGAYLSGAIYAAAAPVSIPNYAPSAGLPTVDGVGVATNGRSWYLFALYAVGTTVGVGRSIMNGERLLLYGKTTLPITGGGGATKTLYVPVAVA